MTSEKSPAKKPDIRKLDHDSNLINRLKGFLPQIELANKTLTQDMQPIDIPISSEEDVYVNEITDKSLVQDSNDTSNQEHCYVELDLACGLFDLRNEDAVAAAEHSLIAQGATIEPCDNSDSNETDGETDDSDEHIQQTKRDDIKRNSKRRKHPGIEELT